MRAYDLDAAAYADRTGRAGVPCCGLASSTSPRASARAPGCWRSAPAGGATRRCMEELGLRVRRTDVTPGFVALLREQGHEADRARPAHRRPGVPRRALRRRVGQRLPAPRRPARPPDGPDPARGGHPARWAAARLASRRATARAGRPTARSAAPRHFTYWRADALREVVAGAGWTDVAVARVRGRRRRRGAWLERHGGARMRHTEFWARLDHALGTASSRSWAELIRHRRARRPHGRRGAGRRRTPPKQVWAAVWRVLELPDSER